MILAVGRAVLRPVSRIFGEIVQTFPVAADVAVLMIGAEGPSISGITEERQWRVTALRGHADHARHSVGAVKGAIRSTLELDSIEAVGLQVGEVQPPPMSFRGIPSTRTLLASLGAPRTNNELAPPICPLCTTWLPTSFCRECCTSIRVARLVESITLMDVPICASGVAMPVAVTTIFCETGDGESVRLKSTPCWGSTNSSLLAEDSESLCLRFNRVASALVNLELEMAARVGSGGINLLTALQQGYGCSRNDSSQGIADRTGDCRFRRPGGNRHKKQ